MSIKPFADQIPVDIGRKINRQKPNPLKQPPTRNIVFAQRFVQGVSISRLRQLSARLVRIGSSDISFKSPSDRYVDNLEICNYGQPNYIEDPSPARIPGVSDGPAPAPFVDIPGRTNPLDVIRNVDYFLSYPQVLSTPYLVSPDSMDGVIDIFDIRKSITHFNPKGPHGSLANAALTVDHISIPLTDVISNQQEAFSFFEDGKDVFMTKGTFSLSTPGYYVPNIGVADPFNATPPLDIVAMVPLRLDNSNFNKNIVSQGWTWDTKIVLEGQTGIRSCQGQRDSIAFGGLIR